MVHRISGQRQALLEIFGSGYPIVYALSDFQDKIPNTGYTRVTVLLSEVKVEYVRTYLPEDEGPGKMSGASVYSYSIK